MNQTALNLSKKTEFFFKKNGPGLLTAAGIGGMIAANVLTARAALKTQDQVKKLKAEADQIKDRENDTEKKAHDLGRHWVVNGYPVVKEFAPAIFVGAVSITCLVTSHRMMKSKQASLVAAYAALDTAYKAYRARVREVVGEEAELELYRAPRVITTEEGGQVTACEIDFGDSMPSIYSRFFDESNPNFTKTPEWNMMFLRMKQTQWNDRLTAVGFVFLNEILDDLGFERCQMGQHVGWRRDAKEKGTGDGYVDFGLYEIFDENKRAFVNGLEPVCLLDFNVDGPIAI
jgi:hypothetical protein